MQIEIAAIPQMIGDWLDRKFPYPRWVKDKDNGWYQATVWLPWLARVLLAHCWRYPAAFAVRGLFQPLDPSLHWWEGFRIEWFYRMGNGTNHGLMAFALLAANICIAYPRLVLKHRYRVPPETVTGRWENTALGVLALGLVNLNAGVSLSFCALGWTCIRSGLGRKAKNPSRFENVETNLIVCDADFARDLYSAHPDDGYAFGGLYATHWQAARHFLWVGKTGSGKTTHMLRWIETVLRDVRQGRARLALYNPKQDFVGKLAAVAPDVPVIITNPYDVRCQPWLFWRDFTTDTDAMELAHMLIPDPPANMKDNAFFIKAARGIVEDLATVYIHRGAPWGLRDIVYGAFNIDVARAIIGTDEIVRIMGEALAGNGETAQNIAMTACAYVRQLRVVAALLHHHEQQGRGFSITDWRGKVLLLGNLEAAQTAITPYNRLLFAYLKRTLDGPDSLEPEPDTFICIDEFADLGKVEGFGAIANKGRSKGLCLGVAFQSIPQLHNIYGRDEAEMILDAFEHRMFLKAGAETAKWMSDSIGQVDQRYVTGSRSQNYWGIMPTGHSEGASEAYRQAWAVPPGRFINLPDAEETGKVEGLARGGRYIWPVSLPFTPLPQPEQPVQDFIRVPKQWEQLPPWTVSDWERLGIKDVMVDLVARLEWEKRRKGRNPDPLDDGLPD